MSESGDRHDEMGVRRRAMPSFPHLEARAQRVEVVGADTLRFYFADGREDWQDQRRSPESEPTRPYRMRGTGR